MSPVVYHILWKVLDGKFNPDEGFTLEIPRARAVDEEVDRFHFRPLLNGPISHMNFNEFGMALKKVLPDPKATDIESQTKRLLYDQLKL